LARDEGDVVPKKKPGSAENSSQLAEPDLGRFAVDIGQYTHTHMVTV